MIPAVATSNKANSAVRTCISFRFDLRIARVKLGLAMDFFRYNDPLQQMLGAIVAAVIFVVILKWAFSSNPKMVVLPVSAGKKEQYGMLRVRRSY